MSDVLTLREYFNFTPSADQKADARTAVVLSMMVRTSDATKTAKKQASFENIIKIFDWHKNIDKEYKKGRVKPDGMPLEEWKQIRKRRRKLEKIAAEIGLELTG